MQSKDRMSILYRESGKVSTTLISTAARLKRQWRRDDREQAESVTFLGGAAAK